MDPIAHTLFGATLGETGLKRLSHLAMPTLLIGANLPDIDAITTVLGRDTSLFLRRGHTHGVLAMVVLPLLLAGGMWLWNRRRPPADGGPPFSIWWITLCAFLSVWSHPALDFMNTYGVRLLMPFDGTWFYGDTLFIIDPWFWLSMSAGAVLANSSTRRAVIRWSVLATLASFLVYAYDAVPVAAKVAWTIGIAAIYLVRRFRPDSAPWVARAGLAFLLSYVAAMFALGRAAERDAAGDSAPIEAQSSPSPANPFAQRVVLAYPEHYRVVGPSGAAYIVQRVEPDEVARAALAAPSIRGFANWMRFPIWSKRRADDGGWVVTFRDLRYVDPEQEARTIGQARVWLDENLVPREP